MSERFPETSDEPQTHLPSVTSYGSYSALACQPLHFTAYINDNTKLDETMDMTSSITRQEP